MTSCESSLYYEDEKSSCCQATEVGSAIQSLQHLLLPGTVEAVNSPTDVCTTFPSRLSARTPKVTELRNKSNSQHE